MLFFVILTNILLLTSLIAILSQSLTKVGHPPASIPPCLMAMPQRLRFPLSTDEEQPWSD